MALGAIKSPDVLVALGSYAQSAQHQLGRVLRNGPPTVRYWGWRGLVAMPANDAKRRSSGLPLLLLAMPMLLHANYLPVDKSRVTPNGLA